MGYPIDFREKAWSAQWPPPWLNEPGSHRFIPLAQWGLGAYERHLAGDGEQWLAAVEQAGHHLLRTQVRSGPHAGGWLEPLSSLHTFRIAGPWLSAMAQGECASLLVRIFLETGRSEFADAARLALQPLSVPTTRGGVRAPLLGYDFPEEYPTSPPSFVLNGAIFAIWGVHDVWKGLDDATAGAQFRQATDMLSDCLHLWDLGYWSRYDLFPHPGVSNVANFNYHRLHISQLRAFHRLEPRPEFSATADRFEGYLAHRVNRARAYVHKACFRLIVPRSPVLSRRVPWRGLRGASPVLEERVSDPGS